jgi:predicted Fe-S protein YdhL (DUF1289 family)
MAHPQSPCTGVCWLDDATGWCVGCGRALTEIASWSNATDDQKGSIFDQLETRLSVMRSETNAVRQVERALSEQRGSLCSSVIASGDEP